MQNRTHMPYPTDLHAPGAIDALLAHHRSVFGALRMENDDATGTAAAGGGTGDTGTGTGTGETATGAGGTGDTGNAGQAGAQPPAWNPDAWDGKVESLPARAQKMLKDRNDEAAKLRTRNKAILEAAGIETGEEDPVKAAADRTRERDEARNEARLLKVERGIAKACKAVSGDEELVTAVLAHQGKLSDLDPTADDFQTTLDDLVKTTVESNTRLKVTQAATASSVNHAGGSGEGQHDLDAQIAEATKKGDHALAIRLKRQRAYTQPTT